MGNRLHSRRIERLTFKELVAVHRGDWIGARRAALEKAALKEGIQRAEAGKVRP